MDRTGPSFEASLMFPAALVSSDLAMLADNVKTVAEAHGLPATRMPTHNADCVLFGCGDLQILVMGCDRPLDVAHFLDAARPEGALLHDTAVLSRLTAHRYSLTVLVADRPGAAPPAGKDRDTFKEKLCWQVTECLRASLRPALVFWCADDTLYSSSEFVHCGPFGTRLPLTGPATLAEGARQHDQQRALEARALTFIHTQIIQGKHRREADTAPDTSHAGPVSGLLALAERHSTQAMRGATMACSTAAAGICLLPLLAGGIA